MSRLSILPGAGFSLVPPVRTLPVVPTRVSVRKQTAGSWHIKPSGRSAAVRTAAMNAKPSLISTLVTEHLSEAAGFSPVVQFLVAHGVGSFLIPLLIGWVVTSAMHYLAGQARAWCEENNDKDPSAEVIGMLPAALEGPTVFTVYIMVAVRLLRNAAWCLDSYVHTFDAKWNRTVDALVETICGYLIPIDQALIKVYSLVMVAFITVVLVKWKTIALEYYLLRRQSQLAAAETAGSSNRGRIKAIKAAAASTEDLERLLVPLDAVSSWLAYAAAVLVCAQVLGFDIAPLLAVGGASSIIVGLATQQLLTNAIMGLSLFITRPFVAGDAVTCQGSGIVMSGVVESVSPMRTTLRSEDDVLVSIPNRQVADMVVYNRSATISSSRLAKANRKTEPLKLRIKVPHAAISSLAELQAAVMEVLAGSTAATAAAMAAATSSGSDSDAEQQPDAASLTGSLAASSSSSVSSSLMLSGGSWSSSGDSPGGAALVAPGSIEVQVAKFTDAGLELLVKSQLRADRSSPAVQAMLLNLNSRVRETGAVLVNL